MREMKDSGIEWIGEIPIEWNVSRIGNHYYFTSGSTLTSEEIEEDGKYPVFGANGSRGFYDKFNLTGENLLIGRVGALCGNVHLVNGDIWFTEHALVALEADNKTTKPYMSYLFEAMELGQYSKASAQPVISSEVIRRLRMPLPSILEQEKISSYLNSKCSQIDSIISKQETIIEKLKEYKQSVITEAVTKGLNSDCEMKDSGNNIGAIPTEWNLTKVKYVCNTQGRIGFKGYTTGDLVDEGEGAYTLGATHLVNGKVDLSEPVYISWEKYYESPEIMVKKGDVLIVQRGSTIGKAAIVDKDYGEVTINPSLVLLNRISISSKYLLYSLLAKYNTEHINLIGNTTAIPMISQKQINDLHIVLPISRNEQDQISEYLDNKCNKIDKEISLIEANIGKLCEYRKSLIYEVVTGKREV